MSERETDIQTDIWAALNQRPDVRVFRNSVGLGYVGKAHFSPGQVTLKQFRKVHFGLRLGSSDLIGWKSVTIRPEDVGKRVAVFVSIEVKRLGETPDDDQKNWLARVRESGGITGVATTTEEASQIINGGIHAAH